MESPAGWREKLKVTLLNPLEKDHSCPNCKDVLRYPVKLGCGHRLCYSCHQEIARYKQLGFSQFSFMSLHPMIYDINHALFLDPSPFVLYSTPFNV